MEIAQSPVEMSAHATHLFFAGIDVRDRGGDLDAVGGELILDPLLDGLGVLPPALEIADDRLDPILQGRRGPRQLNLTSREKLALIAFMETLTDEAFVNDPKFADPFVEVAPSATPVDTATAQATSTPEATPTVPASETPPPSATTPATASATPSATAETKRLYLPSAER